MGVCRFALHSFHKCQGPSGMIATRAQKNGNFDRQLLARPRPISFQALASPISTADMRRLLLGSIGPGADRLLLARSSQKLTLEGIETRRRLPTRTCHYAALNAFPKTGLAGLPIFKARFLAASPLPGGVRWHRRCCGGRHDRICRRGRECGELMRSASAPAPQHMSYHASLRLVDAVAQPFLDPPLALDVTEPIQN